MRATRRGPSQRGFTLIELMIVVAMVGILTTAAVVYIKPTQYAATARGYADQIGATAEAARDRAIGSHAWQRLVVYADTVEMWQAPVTGFVKAADADFQYLGAVPVPSTEVEIAMTEAQAHNAPNTSLPAVGSGLPTGGAFIDFAPDGAAELPYTIFIADQKAQRKARVVVFRATGSVMVFDSW